MRGHGLRTRTCSSATTPRSYATATPTSTAQSPAVARTRWQSPPSPTQGPARCERPTSAPVDAMPRPERECAGETSTAPANLGRTGTPAPRRRTRKATSSGSPAAIATTKHNQIPVSAPLAPRPPPMPNAKPHLIGSPALRATTNNRATVVPTGLPSSRHLCRRGPRSQQRGPDTDLPLIAGTARPPSTRFIKLPDLHRCTLARRRTVANTSARRLYGALMGPNVADGCPNSAEQADTERRLDGGNGGAELPLSGRTFTHSTIHRESPPTSESPGVVEIGPIVIGSCRSRI